MGEPRAERTTLGGTHQPLRALVRDEIRRMIMSGELAPGTRLVEDRLGSQLGVSRNPVREAFQSLAAEGFVTLLPRRGAVVARVSDEQAEELFDVRIALEGLAARLAARNRDAAALGALRQVLSEAQEATERGKLDELAELNTAFHRLVVTAGGNDYLRFMVEPMHRRVQWIFRQSAASRAPHSWTEHVSLLDAIAASDEERSAELAAAHVAAARSSYRNLRSDGDGIGG